MTNQTSNPSAKTSDEPANLSRDLARLQAELQRETQINRIMSRLTQSLDFEALVETLMNIVGELAQTAKAVLLVRDHLDPNMSGLKFGAASTAVTELPTIGALRSSYITLYKVEERPVIDRWIRGEVTPIKTAELPENSPAYYLAQMAQITVGTSFPLMAQELLEGILIIEGALDADTETLLKAISAYTGQMLQNASLHDRTVRQLSSNMLEMSILQQIDRELNDVFELDHVFRMTLDWLLRFTNAQAASLALYNEDTDELVTMAQYGFEIDEEEQRKLLQNYTTSIIHRVARSGDPEIIPDVTMDIDYVPINKATRSQMVLPVIREDRVIAVISLESTRLNGFAENHLNFTQALASRAAVAIDNARLFTETRREREKLSYILSNIADSVVIADEEGRLLLVNPATVSAMHMHANETYTTRAFEDVFDDTVMLEVFRQANEKGHRVMQELTLPNGRIYYVNATPYKGIGQIIVMQDITRFKELDQLKSELIATVSHDLKQPLSIMRGYLDLMMMVGNFNDQTRNYAARMGRAIQNMRNLIDDLLDLARIESGVKLDFEALAIKSVLDECIEAVRPAAESKAMKLHLNAAESLPTLRADRSRLVQIFNNLIGNAVKYTQPEGDVHISADQRGDKIHISVQDNGMGISPEDQAHVFDRFYRVRRPETDSIEGTGLGLAIVKTLIEAHEGEIILESQLGSGSTFTVILPIAAYEKPA